MTDDWKKTRGILKPYLEDETDLRPKNGMRPIHPGEILMQDYIVPGWKSNVSAFARDTGLNRSWVREFCRGEFGITEAKAQQLADALDTTPQIWLNLQETYNNKIHEEKHGTSREETR